MLRIIKFLSITLVALIIASCGSSEYQTLPLDKLNPKLKAQGSSIVKDFLKFRNKERGLSNMLNKDYVTPLFHAQLVKGSAEYNEGLLIANMSLQKISQFQLFQVVNKGQIKSMRYKLTSSNPDIEFAELKLDMNLENNLRDMHLYITTTDGKFKQQNILPEYEWSF